MILLRVMMDNFENEGDCPCCCHHERDVECVNNRANNARCVVSEYPELDVCCEEASQ